MDRNQGRRHRFWVIQILVLFLLSVVALGFGFNESSTQADPIKKGKVNINTCSKRELAKKLPGMTPSKANKIIKGRPYSRIYDLVNKKILTKKELSRVRDLITVGNP
jgi:DNA uptake protein ComE-like DNA-binding protein